MSQKVEVLIAQIRLDADGKGLSIPVRPYVQAGDQIYYGETITKNFRTILPIYEKVGEALEVAGYESNPNFHSEIDEFTGTSKFIENRFNF